MKKRVLIGFGTRPEAIKMAPLVKVMQQSADFDSIVLTTGQHKEMLRQVLDVFGIIPDYEIELIRKSPDLAELTTALIEIADRVIVEASPDVVCVQGDTTTTFALSLVAFYHKIKVVHLEAGLRTDSKFSPFPEEINRRLTSTLADLHLAPTPISAANLIREGVDEAKIVITGNTVIDALLSVVNGSFPFETEIVPKILSDKREFVLVTMHRREAWGEPMVMVSKAIGELAKTFKDLDFVLPLHPNQLVQEAMRSGVSGLENVIITEPVPYGDFCRLMNGAKMVITDSGGIQEEAPSLGKPVLVARDTTERPEAVLAGTAKLVGTQPSQIVAEASRLLSDPQYFRSIAQIANPFGDGSAALRSLMAIGYLFGMALKPADFVADSLRDSKVLVS